ncbi:MAG: TrkH family potassium uptake protein [Phycisphaerales bacterium]
MNVTLVVTEIGRLLMLLSGLLGAVALLGVWDGWQAGDAAEEAVRLTAREDWLAAAALGLASVVAVLAGLAMRHGAGYFRRRRKKGPGPLGRREAVLLVTGSWVVGGVLAAIPYYAWSQWEGPLGAEVGFDGIVPCLFESISGLTTCGATILTDIEALPRAILLWRSLTQWIGGLGVVLLFVAVLPSLGVGGKRLFMAESTGPAPEGLRPHVRSTARTLWGFYVVLTLAQTLLLMLCGLGAFDALNHAFTTLSTGGFSTRNASIAAFDSVAVEAVITPFMILGGVSFVVYDRLLKRRFELVWRDPELRMYLVTMAGAMVLIAGALLYRGTAIETVAGGLEGPGFGASLRAGVFTAASIMTTTGYCTADFDLFPIPAIAVILVLMLIGGCAGSTGSGVKVIRAWIGVRQVVGEIEREFRPSVVRPLRLGRRIVDAATISASTSLLLAAMVAVAIGTFLVFVFESGRDIDPATAFSAALSSLGNVGPGLGSIGAVETYAGLTDATQVVLLLLMLLGRLEFFAVLAIFSRRFWSRG